MGLYMYEEDYVASISIPTYNMLRGTMVKE